ncbi:hypothetical protein KIN20_025396 [Parelaphostrongylus tenuis]|uniref:Uncharacterized protein n=1 Tax=Parelaphostrongylus tenuis TaxID=148309 RepID=A0AAD5MV70_PARTN|nr:hypothetical protein KIN20_025396 [Parelaphostrongylus tenuis]
MAEFQYSRFSMAFLSHNKIKSVSTKPIGLSHRRRRADIATGLSKHAMEFYNVQAEKLLKPVQNRFNPRKWHRDLSEYNASLGALMNKMWVL